ncbi:hypothetical protein, partial [Klebsiella pneumoniae]|uniref:hypothetical protein n=1 Tax=Klebsiella pneumoniae TaxID=573 RepID=UPI003F63D8A4
MDNIEQLRKVATRAGKLLTSLSESIRQQKEELKLTEFYHCPLNTSDAAYE